jgi:hypothetical protein
MNRWLKPLTILVGMCVLSAQEAPLELQILVIGGEGSINNVKQRTAREPVVEVRDRNNKPVAGALVLFEAPGNGASGTFIGGSRTLRVTTDAQGRASGQGFRPNNAQGNFNLQVTATAGGATATTAIHMQNAGAALANAGHAAGHGKLIGIVVAVAAAAAAGGAYAATHGGNNGAGGTPAATPTTISAGTGAVSGRP